MVSDFTRCRDSCGCCPCKCCKTTKVEVTNKKPLNMELKETEIPFSYGFIHASKKNRK
jgi:hypothetical protein